jgi:hypothetical protein
MKKIIVLLVMLVPSVVFASPFVVSDPYASTVVQPTEFVVRVDGGADVVSPVETVTGGVRLQYDVGGVSAGSHTITVKAVRIDPIWGRLESTTVNFTFVRPAAPTAPASIGLEP